MKGKLMLIVLLLLGQLAGAQVMLNTQASNCGGSFYEDDEIKISANIGEMTAVHTIFITDLIVSNGVLQPLRSIGPRYNNQTPGFFKIYPTVLEGRTVFIESLLSQRSNMKIRLLNQLGQLHRQWQFSALEDLITESVELPDLAKGHYILEILFTDAMTGLPYDRKAVKIQKR